MELHFTFSKDESSTLATVNKILSQLAITDLVWNTCKGRLLETTYTRSFITKKDFSYELSELSITTQKEEGKPILQYQIDCIIFDARDIKNVKSDDEVIANWKGKHPRAKLARTREIDFSSGGKNVMLILYYISI